MKKIERAILKERRAEEYYDLMARVTHRDESAKIFTDMADSRYNRKEELQRKLKKLRKRLSQAA